MDGSTIESPTTASGEEMRGRGKREAEGVAVVEAVVRGESVAAGPLSEAMKQGEVAVMRGASVECLCQDQLRREQ